MVKIKDNQYGFGAVETVIVIVIIAVIGVAGFMVYKTQDDNKQSVVKSSETAEKPTNEKSQTTPSNVSVVTKENLQGISLNAPKCGSQAAISQAQPNSFDLKYTKPKNWSTLDTYPNGASFKSTDFNSEQGFRNISTGASLTLAVQAICSDGKGLAVDMESYAQNQTMETGTQLTYIKIAGYYGVKFKHNAGENHNNHDVALLFKNDRMYNIEEQFNYSATNPYPNIVDQTLDTIE